MDLMDEKKVFNIRQQLSTLEVTKEIALGNISPLDS